MENLNLYLNKTSKKYIDKNSKTNQMLLSYSNKYNNSENHMININNVITTQNNFTKAGFSTTKYKDSLSHKYGNLMDMKNVQSSKDLFAKKPKPEVCIIL